MPSSLEDILRLVGTLDDSPGENTPRERFRDFLPRHIESVGHARDLIEACLRGSDLQHARALQDLVNYTGRFLGFEVEHGLYQGVAGEVGHDGLWESPTGFHVVIETKTSEAFNIKTATLSGYVDQLISEGRISSWENAMGLYVVGDPDPEVSQLEDAIVAQNKTDQLRTISTDALLSLAELLSEYDVSHEAALAVLRPSGPSIDPIAKLMARIVAQEQVRQESTLDSSTAESTDGEATPTEKNGEVSRSRSVSEVNQSWWLTPVSDKGEMTSKQVIYRLVGQEQIYGYRKSTPGRKDLSPGDGIAFYASGEGVVAHAEVATRPEEKEEPDSYLPVPDAEDFPYIFRLRDPVLYLDEPMAIDRELRGKLEEFEDRDLSKAWSWFVQSSREVSRHDFEVLTR